MKKVLYFGLLLASTFSACSDEFLEREPLNAISETIFWQSEEDVYLAVNAIYASLPGSGTMYYDGATDIVHAQYPWESTATSISSGVVNTSLNAGWTYVDKRRANYFLENVDRATMDENLRERYKAEVRFIRAYSYFRMVNYYGDVPLVTTVLGSTEEELNIPRTPKAEVVEFILNELTAAADALPISYAGGRSNEVGRITRGAALALKARVYLYNERYTEAAETASQVMTLGYRLFQVNEEASIDTIDNYNPFVDFTDAEEEETFRLALRSYEGLFHAANEGNSEVILDRQYVPQTQPQYLNTYLLEGSVGGWSSLTPTQNLVDAYQSFKTGEAVTLPTASQRAERYALTDKTQFVSEFRNRDPRFYATILFETAPWNAVTSDGGYVFSWVDGASNMSQTGYNFRKLVDPASNRANLASDANIILIRYAEVLLTYAEAQNEASGPQASIYDAIDLIRTRAGMPPLNRTRYNTQATLREAIRQERKVELALEGFRYMDIRRWEIAPQVMSNIYDVKNTLAQERVWNDRLYLMPVPQREIDLSFGVLTQNLGYQ